ncbi:MAG: hypothetical protein AB1817_18185, partial [Chloroflexota bacterium]
PVAPTITWTLGPPGGTHTGYVKYRDAKGRIAAASDTIVFGAATAPTSTAPRATLTRTPTRVTPRPSVIATVALTETPTEILPVPTTAMSAEIAPTETPGLTVAMANAVETPIPTRVVSSSTSVREDAGSNFDGLGLAVVAVMSIVLIRVWALANH